MFFNLLVTDSLIQEEERLLPILVRICQKCQAFDHYQDCATYFMETNYIDLIIYKTFTKVIVCNCIFFTCIYIYNIKYLMLKRTHRSHF